MGYHVRILRTTQGKQLPISLEEAVSVTSNLDGWRHIESLPTFEFVGKEDPFTLWYQDGELWTKNPEEWQIGVMVALAIRLNARVRGMNGKRITKPGILSNTRMTFTSAKKVRLNPTFS